MTKTSWPPIKDGTKVVTTKANPKIDDWAKEVVEARQWGVKAIVITHYDSHVLSYKVRHEDGTDGYYDSSELQVAQEMIFMGAGEHSEAECKKLHGRLDVGLSLLGGMQQMGSCGDVFEPCTPEEFKRHMAEEMNQGHTVIMAVIEDIASALGAKIRRDDDEMRFILEVEIKRE